MCEILENIFKNLEDVENQSNSLREHLFQAETELAQVVAATSKCEEEAATLGSTKDRRLLEVNQKEVQFETLVQKEELLKKILSLRTEELNLEKNKVVKLQDEIFAQRTKFCNKVWEFSDYIAAEGKKNDHSKRDDENVHEEELLQLEVKKSVMEAELDKTNTKLNVIIKQLQEVSAENEELELYTNSEEYLDLERNLQSVLEENKILEKAVNTLIATVDNIHEGKTENKQLGVIESTNTHTESSLVSSRKKVSYYCYETVEERAMHTSQHTSSNNSSVNFNDSPYKLQSDFSKEQKDFRKSFYYSPQKVMSDVNYIEKSGNGGIHHPDIARESDKCLGYPGILYKKNLHGYSDQMCLLPPLSENSNNNPKNGDFKTTNRNGNNRLHPRNLGILQEKQLLPVTSTNQYHQYRNVCVLDHNLQEASPGTESSSLYHKPQEGEYQPNINGGEMKSFHAYTDQTYNADRYRRIYDPSVGRRIYHPSVGSSHNIPAFSVHNLQDSYQHYEAPKSVRDKLDRAHVTDYYKDNDTESAKHYHALKSPNPHASYGLSLSQEQSPYHGACRPDQGGYGREAWPPQWHDKTPWLSPHKNKDYNTHGTALEGVTQTGNRNWPCDEQAHVSHQPEYANYNSGNPREEYRAQQTSVSQSQRPASYPQWHGVEGDNAFNRTADFRNSRGAGYHQLPVNEANFPCNPGESNKENNNMSGYAGTWRPKVRVAKELRLCKNIVLEGFSPENRPRKIVRFYQQIREKSRNSKKQIL